MPSSILFRSLRLRLLLPIVGCAVLAAVAVASGSLWLGNRWATEERDNRFQAIRTTLSEASFPLNAIVLDSLAELTQTELVALGHAGQIRQSTLAGLSIGWKQEALAPPDRDRESQALFNGASWKRFDVEGQLFRAYQFPMVGGANRADRVHAVVVLFDEQRISDSRRRAAALPLLTGLSTIIALSSITLVLTSRLVGRIAKLHHQVEAVALGNFQSTVSDDGCDELGRLSHAVDSMARQLDQLWKRIHRQQSEKLLHQIAGGMAHQLRNSLTGARMAVELHANDCPHAEDEGVQIAIRQIESAEDYVRRLLLVAAGQQDVDRPASVLSCWQDVRSSLSPIAKHLRIAIDWQADPQLENHQVKDGPTWIAAVTNLVHNAMQAGDDVQVDAVLLAESCVQVLVSDNGPGISDSVATELFEPFVTSKPEGLGLGLPLVRRAASSLNGDVRWTRQDDRTVFEFSAGLIAIEEKV